MISKVTDFISNWFSNNVFNFKKPDACAYLVLYIVLPVIITWLSVKHTSDKISEIYCYLTVFISAANSIYDACNRWMGKNFKNIKLFITGLGYSAIAGYSIYIILSLLITGKVTKCDWFFYSYVLVLIVTLPDVISCFTIDMAYKECVASGIKEGE